MSIYNLSMVEKKVLGALIMLSNDELVVCATVRDIARAIGYKDGGGIISAALRTLETYNKIAKIKSSEYRILL